ncbi:integrase repeat-containing protein [Shewanella sp. FDAARGOS_354]|uniref:integrase repeat-containing protein n=1 Tax=Shewanella sp. FDAARGOS_354 TaxID=1930557 RepID=UPI000B51BA56|nr:integrase repeat-containing protein [Shewanella sp. FDAARGOS_354]ASF16242.1 hypothetical protein CEQ32_15360 [Shewanella sp. FDAARGOS_354]
MKKCFYASLTEAQLAAKALGITSQVEYQQRHLENPRLPSTPNKMYSADWQSWDHFLGKDEKNAYPSFTEAQLVAQTLGITAVPEYQKRYHEDLRLPKSPGINVE